MTFSVVIPARYASTRLPGKPLQMIGDQPMIVHVLRQAQRSGAERVIVATDDTRIADVVHAQGGEACLTDANHRSGSDRIAEVIRQFGFADDAIIVNVQGDEPLIPPAVIRQVAELLAVHPAQMATLATPIHDMAEVINPNAVKVVVDQRGQALYFSRAPIPWHRDRFADGIPAQCPPDAPWWRHIGIYAYRAGFVQQYVTWPAGVLEQLESLEQLRVLENGHAIQVALACEIPPAGVDTPDDLARVRRLLA